MEERLGMTCYSFNDSHADINSICLEDKATRTSGDVARGGGGPGVPVTPPL